MARIRTIKPETFTSDDVDALTIHARWTWVGLWTHADDEGRARADPRLIKAAVWPIDDTVSPAAVTSHLDEMERRAMICRYSVDGVAYLHVVNFTKHQRINRPSPSKHPACSRDVHGGLSEDSVKPHEPLPDDSRPEQGTGNREGEQGAGKAPSAGALALRPDASVTQRSKRITDAYAAVEPMCKWPAINGVVIKAIKSQRFSDDEIRDGLLRLAAEGRSVTVETLRVELAGIPPGNGVALRNGAKPSTTDQRVAAAQALKGKFGGAA